MTKTTPTHLGSWGPALPDQAVRLKDKPGRVGMTTGKTKTSGSKTLVQIEFGLSEKQFKSHELLELAKLNEGLFDILASGKFGDSSDLRSGTGVDEKRHDLQKIAGYVIAEFRRKEPLKVFGNPAGPIQSKDDRLIVFIGGGGVGPEWYKNAINSTHEEFVHNSIKIPPYELRETPYPPDFKLNGVARKDYHRFTIAYGFSVPYGEGPDTSLPSNINPVEIQKVKNATVPNYLDSKDVYD